MTWIKICGTTNREDALAAVSAGADAVGFVFASSPRQITPEAARDIAAALPAHVERVGVFAGDSAERIQSIARVVGLDIVQLHGDESADFVAAVARDDENKPRFRVFKAVAVKPGGEAALRNCEAYDSADALLLDSAVLRAGCTGQGTDLIRGGTGVSFDWQRAAEVVPALAQRTRVILAGGLSPANVAEAVRLLRPWGVDVCSGVEKSPGIKDHEKMRAFVTAVRTPTLKPDA
ncbi:MAG: phosphoribosylanthranilate isomerase [Terriglobales bacterium]